MFPKGACVIKSWDLACGATPGGGETIRQWSQ